MPPAFFLRGWKPERLVAGTMCQPPVCGRGLRTGGWHAVPATSFCRGFNAYRGL